MKSTPNYRLTAIMQNNTIETQKQKGRIMCEFNGEFLPLTFVEESQSASPARQIKSALAKGRWSH